MFTGGWWCWFRATIQYMTTSNRTTTDQSTAAYRELMRAREKHPIYLRVQMLQSSCQGTLVSSALKIDKQFCRSVVIGGSTWFRLVFQRYVCHTCRWLGIRQWLSSEQPAQIVLCHDCGALAQQSTALTYTNARSTLVISIFPLIKS